MSLPYGGRGYGKSHFARLWKEWALDSGKKVMSFGPNGTILEIRKKHLTLIKTVPYPESEATFIFDEWDGK